MPAYVNSPFQKPTLLQKGVPLYLLGSFNALVGNTQMFVTNVAATGGVATVTATILNGPLPTVGEYISIINTTSSGGQFNVTRAVITGVTIDSTTGAGTLAMRLPQQFAAVGCV